MEPVLSGYVQRLAMLQSQNKFSSRRCIKALEKSNLLNHAIARRQMKVLPPAYSPHRRLCRLLLNIILLHHY